MQNSSQDLIKKFSEIKGGQLSESEKSILKERLKYGKIWLDNFAPEEFVFKLTKHVPESVIHLSKEQKKYLMELANLLEGKDFTAEQLQNELFVLTQKQNIQAKKAFEAIYLSLIGKTHGPKAGWLITGNNKKLIIKRLHDVLTYKLPPSVKKYLYPVLKREDLIAIDPKLKSRFPSVTVGVAIIKNVTIKKYDLNLEKEINDFISSAQNLTTRQISDSPEILSYRRIYKETGVDWHSNRPSPEALLRRIATKKDLPKINTCVDAYNLIVMKYRVSAGAFNLDKIQFPTVLRFAKKGDKIQLLGDKKYTSYHPREVAYFDQMEGYNIDFNYLDSERTKVDQNTKNLWINVEGVYDITRVQVEKTLQETIAIILKYCGGHLELAGIVQ